MNQKIAECCKNCQKTYQLKHIPMSYQLNPRLCYFGQKSCHNFDCLVPQPMVKVHNIIQFLIKSIAQHYTLRKVFALILVQNPHVPGQSVSPSKFHPTLLTNVLLFRRTMGSIHVSCQATHISIDFTTQITTDAWVSWLMF